MSFLKKLLNSTFEEKSEPLPIGLTEFDAWAAKIIAAAGIPDNDSTRFALSTMVLYVDQGTDRVPAEHFITRLRKGASNETVSQVMHDLKEKQKAAEEARIAATIEVKSEALNEASASEPQQ